MGPTVQQIVKRLCAIEDRIESRTPVVRWLDVYKSEADIERQKAEAKAEGEALARPLILLCWQRPT